MYKPLPDSVTIKQSPIHGFGLYALERIKKGTLIGITHHINSHAENGVIRTPLGGFGNHSDIQWLYISTHTCHINCGPTENT